MRIGNETAFLPLLVALTLGWYVVAATLTSSSDYNAAYYDRARHFTPDGRLLQVEYAMRAAEHSAPLLVCRLDDETLVLMTVGNRKLQSRILVVDDDDDGCVIAMSGILSDNVALWRHATDEWWDWMATYGEDNAGDNRVRMQVLSKAIAQRCHENTMGGIRPYGATMLLAGAVDTRLNLVQTDPSGAISAIACPPLDRPEAIQLLAIHGGDLNGKRNIERAIQKYNDNPTAPNTNYGGDKGTSLLWRKLQCLTDAILRAAEPQDPDPPAGFFFRRKKKPDPAPTPPLSPRQVKLEAVLVSTKLGIHRLTSEQVRRLLPPPVAAG